MVKEHINANDVLARYIGTEGYYRYMCGMAITDGVKALAEKYKCYWLLDIVASYQHELKRYEFQVWKFERTGEGGVVICENGNKKVLRKQEIEHTAIECDEATIWIEGNVMLLPSEH